MLATGYDGKRSLIDDVAWKIISDLVFAGAQALDYDSIFFIDCEFVRCYGLAVIEDF